MVVRPISLYDDYYFNPLYPHDFEDLVFIIFQCDKLKGDVQLSSVTPIAQWFIIIFLASIIIHGLRTIVKRRERRILRIISDDEAPENYVYTLVDSVGVFLGTAIEKFGNCRAECWFLVAFAVFGMLFKMIYTDQLFAMFIQSNPTRINSIDQLIDANIPIFTDPAINKEMDNVQIRIKS